MKKILSFCMVITAFAFILQSCGEKTKPVEVGELVKYEDPYVHFSVQYPSNWFDENKMPGTRLIIYTEKKAVDRFKTYSDKGHAGAKIDFAVVKLSGDTTLEAIMNQKTLNVQYSQPEKVTFGGVEGFKKTYKHKFSDGEFYGEVYYATKDGKLDSILCFEAFGGTFDAYKAKFAEILANAQLAYIPEGPQAQVITKDTIIQGPPPSSNLVSKSGNGFSISIPDNFKVQNMPAKGNTLSSTQYIGERRRDSYIQIDVKDAAKLGNLEKITNGYHEQYPGAGSVSNITLGGLKATSMTFVPANGVKGKLFLLLKDKLLYQIVMVWSNEEEADYKPVFEKSVATFKAQ